MNVGTVKDIMRCDVLLVCFWPCYRRKRCPRLVLATCGSNLDFFMVPLPRVVVQHGDTMINAGQKLFNCSADTAPPSALLFLTAASSAFALLFFCVRGQEVQNMLLTLQ